MRAKIPWLPKFVLSCLKYQLNFHLQNKLAVQMFEMDVRKPSREVAVCQDIDEEYKLKEKLGKGSFG